MSLEELVLGVCNGVLSSSKKCSPCSECFGQRRTLFSYQPPNLMSRLGILYFLSMLTVVVPSGLK